MPNWKRAIERRLAPLALAPTRHAEIVEELSQHLDDRYADLRARGADEATAGREALAELDGDLVRDLTGIHRPPAEPVALGGGSTARGAAGGLLQDVRFGARLLIKEKGTTAVIVFTLALGIAANAIVFGFTDLLLLRPLPFGNASRLAMVYGVDHRSQDNRARLSIPEFRDLQSQVPSLEDVAATTGGTMSLTGAGDALAVNVKFVTANLFRVQGVTTVKGRTFLPGEDAPGQSAVAILGHRFWTTRLGGDDAVLGRTLTLNGRGYTVVGVVTPAIEIGNLAAIDMWVPFETADPAARRDARALTVFGLLKPGATLTALNAELTPIADRMARDFPATNAGWRIHAISFREAMVGANTWVLLALLGVIVGLVLLVACANVATVMLARASARRREIAVRLALGATRLRLARQLVSEGLLLGLIGGVVGLGLTWLGLIGFTRLSDESFFQRLEINANLLVFTFALSLIAPMLFGVLPALQASRPNLNEDLKDGGRDGASAVRSGRTLAALTVAQVAFALALLIVAGLVVRSVIALQRAPLGITTGGVLVARVRLDPPKYVDGAGRVRAVEAMIDGLRAIPGVTAAAAMTAVPAVDGEPRRRFVIAGRAVPTAADTPWAVESATAGDYQETFALPLIAGRWFSPGDRAASAPVALVSREAARRHWPAGQSPLGDRIRILDSHGSPAGESIEIVGVVDDVKGPSVAEPSPPRVYRPLVQLGVTGAAGDESLTSVALALRVDGDATVVAPAVRDTLRRFDDQLVISTVDTMTALVRGGLRNMELVLGLFGSFSGVALLLAIAGVYGVTAFSAGQRRHEIGVRMALGATRGDVVRLVVGGSARLMAGGVAIGIAGALLIGRAMGSVLFGVGAEDATTYLAVIGVLGLSGLAASLVPALRATRVDPTVALRAE